MNCARPIFFCHALKWFIHRPSATVTFLAAPSICAGSDQKFQRRRRDRRGAGLYFKDDNQQLGDNSQQA